MQISKKPMGRTPREELHMQSAAMEEEEEQLQVVMEEELEEVNWCSLSSVSKKSEYTTRNVVK